MAFAAAGAGLEVLEATEAVFFAAHFARDSVPAAWLGPAADSAGC